MPILLKCGTRGRTLDRDELKSRQASPKKERVAFYLSEDLADEIRNAVVHFSGPPLRLTMTSVAEMAFQKELERLKAEHNGGISAHQQYAHNVSNDVDPASTLA